MDLIRILIIVTIFGLSACVGMGSQPKWVDGQTKEYPAAQYLKATGQGRDSQQAINQAKANLARIFTSQVMATTADDNASLRVNGVASNTQRIAEYITTFTDYTLEGVEIARQWADKDTGTASALAVLDRQAATNRLRSKMQSIDSKITNLLNAAGSTKDKLTSAAKLADALDLQIERDALQTSLQIVDPSGIGQPAKNTQALLQQRLDRALGKTTVATKVLNDSVGDIEELIHAGLQSVGVNVSNNTFDYLLDIQAASRGKGKREGWFWKEGSLSLTLRDHSGNVLNVAEWTLKSAAQSPARAEERLRQDFLLQIKVQLLKFLLSRE